MASQELLELLEQVAAGALSPDEAAVKIHSAPFVRTVSGLNLDLQRKARTGLGEVVFAPGKNNQQLLDALRHLHRDGEAVLATRLTPEQGLFLREHLPQGEYWAQARLFCLGGSGLEHPSLPPGPEAGLCQIVTAGGADLPVALEALGTARFLGLQPGLITDVGVAGLHRVEPHLGELRRARLLIVCAGMEGALPSVLGGLCGKPIIAVPTSIGYGASFGGLAALLAMLNSCAPGVAVVNIDNGFGAAVLARKLLATDS